MGRQRGRWRRGRAVGSRLIYFEEFLSASGVLVTAHGSYFSLGSGMRLSAQPFGGTETLLRS